MARFLTRSQLSRVTPVLGHYYRSSLGLFSTTPNMKFGNPNNLRKRMEQRNEKHRMVQQLAEDMVILSCESTAKGGVCDVYVVGTTHHTPKSCREVQAVMSYLKPEVLFLELCQSRSILLHLKKVEKCTVRDIGKAILGKHINVYSGFDSWRYHKYASKFEASEFNVAYQEAMKYGCKVVLGDRPQEVHGPSIIRSC